MTGKVMGVVFGFKIFRFEIADWNKHLPVSGLVRESAI